MKISWIMEGELAEEMEKNFTRAIHFNQKVTFSCVDNKGEALSFVGDANSVKTDNRIGEVTFVIVNAVKKSWSKS